MPDPLFSASWYRVADLKPRLRSHARIHRHDYRGDVWYVLYDPCAGRSHRYSPATHYVISLMDGRRTANEIWEASCHRLGDDAPTQDDTIRLLGQLHSADLLVADTSPDSQELFRRHRRHWRMKLKQRLWSPLALRFPLLDPDRFVERTVSWVQPLFGWFGFLLWLSVTVAGALVVGLNWPELTHNLADRVLTPSNILLLWLIYPVVKTFHELGHAYAVKRWGGEVHEIGIMFLVFMPVPYVDASSATAFRDKRKRMMVGSVGILAELFLAGVAAIVWASVEPGLVRTAAYNVMLIGGVSTILFNGNPLLKFDGYYVLADAIEIPNLGTRSNNYYGYLFQRYLFGVKDAKSPVGARGERGWFLFYGLAAFAYRMFIMFAIIVLVASQFFFVGVLLAIWAAFTQLVIPMGKIVAFLFSDRRLGRQRGRAVATSATLLAVALGLLFMVPAPFWTLAEGLVWAPDNVQVRAGADGFVKRLLVEDGSWVKQGTPLIESEDPFLLARVDVLVARLRELEVQLPPVVISDPGRAHVIREQILAARADLEDARDRVDDLVVESPVDGRVFISYGQDLIGRFVRQGELLAFVLDKQRLIARVVVDQDAIGLIRERQGGVDVWPADWSGEPSLASIAREVPGGSHALPARALGTAGGGSFAVDPADPEGLKTLERVFQLELTLLEPPTDLALGKRMYARFDHGVEPLGWQWYRSLRQLLLGHFGV